MYFAFEEIYVQNHTENIMKKFEFLLEILKDANAAIAQNSSMT